MEEQNKEDKTKKTEECQDLKNLQYKTMLMKGKRTLLLPKNTSDDTAGIEKLLEREMSLNKNISWSRLDRSIKMRKLQEYAKVYSKKHELTEKESQRLSKYLNTALERNRLHKVREVKYNKETEIIEDIPCLLFNKESRKFTLKRSEKRVSTLSSLGGGSQSTRKKRGNRKKKGELNDKLK
tara:strand:+ start:3095 stop:3637 length:543 start_codon:yes stop_codon:yes gene_type:complete